MKSYIYIYNSCNSCLGKVKVNKERETKLKMKVDFNHFSRGDGKRKILRKMHPMTCTGVFFHKIYINHPFTDLQRLLAMT